jgi:lycopene beta-cyclase
MNRQQQPFIQNYNSQSGEYYDYVIAGAGAAGLSLLMHIIDCGKLQDKRILLIDKDPKKANDRTWCFWEKEPGPFQNIVYKEWTKLFFYSDDLSKELKLAPYTYKLIRGLDFYTFCFEKIKQHPNIFFLQAAIENISSDQKETSVLVNGKKIYATYIFNSILFQKPTLNRRQYWLLQHFKGWVIETEHAAFNNDSATLMDFRTDQSRGTAFFYVLPFSANAALVEYTLFSPQLLSQGEYEAALKNYIEEQLGITGYFIKEKEFGVIPMTNYPFPKRKNNIINIGTAGGQTKGSSGYTFSNIQKHSSAIVKALVETGDPLSGIIEKKRFLFYDSVLLHILFQRKLEGKEIFTLLFTKNKTVSVLQFLDNETSLQGELNIIKSLPMWPFLKAAIKQTGL